MSQTDLDPEMLREACVRHQVGLVVVFGSRARGTPRPGSDLDVGVLHAEERPLSFRELADLSQDLAAAGDAPVDVVDLAGADAIFRFEVLRDGALAYADTDHRWRSFVARTLIEHDDIAPFVDAMIRGVGRRAIEESVG